MKQVSLIIIIIAIGISVFFIFKQSMSKNIKSQSTKNQEDKSSTPEVTKKVKQLSLPKITIDQNKKYEATMKTSEGDIVIQLNTKETPKTVNNFVYLANNNFYDKTIFHRVIKGFMIQGGDPVGDGTGGPGYRFDDEVFTGEYLRGTIAMANAGTNTNGSQFFIMHKDYDLPKNYVIFGKVISGIDIVDKIAEAKTESNPATGENSKPVNPAAVKTITINEK